MHSHYRTTTNPEAVHVAAANERRRVWILPISVVATIALIALRIFAHRIPTAWLFVGIAAALLAMFGLPYGR